MARNTVASIRSGALRHNLAAVRRLCPSSRVIAVVKADAYGHRLRHCLAALSQADMLAVATLDEARQVRALGSRQPVLLLEGFNRAEELPVIAELALETVVHNRVQLDMLKNHRAHVPERIWLKLDSGMHRLGFQLDDAAAVHRCLHDLPGVRRVNLMTHFACADQLDHALTSTQLQCFDQATASLSGEQSLANSAAILEWPASHREWVRAGILLYGISPLPCGHAGEHDLQPAMTLTTELIAINEVRAGESIGYGARFVASRDLRVGVAAIGYGDGYPRNAPDGTPVLINGQRAAIAGCVSMDMLTVDLTDLPSAAIGDGVVLWGDGLPIEEIARSCATIPYELVCRVTNRVRFETI